MKTALVLSGGGLFGAWQAGAWRALAASFHPDLVVGASVGALNGYAIASGASPDQLAAWWLNPETAKFNRLAENIRALMHHFSLRISYAAVLTDVTRMKPKIFRDRDVTWRHLAASCAVPGVLPQYRIGGRWYSDGGLLNPLPVYAAAELGATRILALNALPQIPSRWLRPVVKAFRRVAGHHPPLAREIEIEILETPGPLGTMREALRWKRENVERWMQLGFDAARNISMDRCFGP